MIPSLPRVVHKLGEGQNKEKLHTQQHEKNSNEQSTRQRQCSGALALPCFNSRDTLLGFNDHSSRVFRV